MQDRDEKKERRELRELREEITQIIVKECGVGKLQAKAAMEKIYWACWYAGLRKIQPAVKPEDIS